MSKIRYIYFVALAAVAMLLAACSSDDGVVTDGPDVPHDGTSKVTLRIGVAGNGANSTRAAWEDNNATDDEMMNIWVVVIADSGNHAEKVFACKPSADAEREIDLVANDIELSNGTHNFYSFANMSVEKVKEMLDIQFTMQELSEGGTVVEATGVSGTVDANKVVAVNGNNFDPAAEDNGFGAKGIPMSNRQTFLISSDVTIDIIVIRMLAKMQLKITNQTGEVVTLKDIAVSDITDNPETGKTNLMLLPKLAVGDDDMEANHGDIQPNLGSEATTGLCCPDLTEEKTIENNKTEIITFYINESAEPKNSEKLFELTLTLDNGEYRYAVIDNSNDGYDDIGKWNYIARNDYRIIPITLDDYKLELIPYDFPPIGVLPASVRELDETRNLYEMTFHDYGHFHLVPQVTKESDKSLIPFNDRTVNAYWTLNTDWDNSWFTYDMFGGTLSTDGNPAGFYIVETTPSIVDGSENGGIPVLDTQTTWNGFSPFIFGNIAKPSSDGAKSVYHEFKVKLHTPTYERYMIYRFNMVLSADRMLSPAKRNALPRRQH